MERNNHRGNRPPPKDAFQDGSFRKKKRSKDRGRRPGGKDTMAPGNVEAMISTPQSQERGANPPGSHRDSGPSSQGRTGRPFPGHGKSQRFPSEDGRNEKSRRFSGSQSKNPSTKERSGTSPTKSRSETPPPARAKFQAALEEEEKSFKHMPKKYDVLLYDTLGHAHLDLAQIKSRASQVDQLNVVIRAESNMDDPVITEISNVKIFAGSAWTLIHERRIQDGWYEKPQ